MGVQAKVVMFLETANTEKAFPCVAVVILSLFYLPPNLRQILLHRLGIAVGDDFQQLLQFEADVLHLGGGAGVSRVSYAPYRITSRGDRFITKG